VFTSPSAVTKVTDRQCSPRYASNHFQLLHLPLLLKKRSASQQEWQFILPVADRKAEPTSQKEIWKMKEVTTTRKRNYLQAFLVLFLIAGIPLILWSFPRNPPLGKTGAPGEGTCADCHTGGFGGGRIKITSSTGTTYHPGAPQHLKVTITDPNATFWGYEITSVKTSNPTVGKGVFMATDSNSDVRMAGTISYASQIKDLQGKTLKASYAFDWTPPPTNVGNITLYVAGIGGTGDPSSDSVYTSQLTLTPN
jgi:hypothetical protein